MSGRFLSMAKASCAEVRPHLYVALDAGYLSDSEFRGLHDQAAEAGSVIGGLRVSIERKRDSV
jgi:four helix bundle protein